MYLGVVAGVAQSFKAAWAVDGRGTNCYLLWQG